MGVHAQETGVKISLTLNPSAPEKPKSNESKSASATEKNKAPAQPHLALSSFELKTQEAGKGNGQVVAAGGAASDDEGAPENDVDSAEVAKSPVTELEALNSGNPPTPPSPATENATEDGKVIATLVGSNGDNKSKPRVGNRTRTKNGAAPPQKVELKSSHRSDESAALKSDTKSPEPAPVPPKSEVAKSESPKPGISAKIDAIDTAKIKPLKLDAKSPSPDDNENGECPGGAEGDDKLLKLPEDIPLEQEAHPYDAPAAEYTAKPDRPAVSKPVTKSFTGEQLKLRNDINRCLNYFMQNPETIARRSPWAVMHAILPYGVEAELIGGNRRVNAIGWMCHNGLCKTQRIFQSTQNGFRTNLGPGVQGHEGQFLAILAQSKVAPNFPIKVGNRSYTVQDLVRYEMATCKEDSELTFKLIGLSYYLEQNQSWRDSEGGFWNLEKMVAEELEQPIVGAACGGTHRLMGLTFSLLRRKQAGLPIEGHWQRSEQYLNDFVQYAFTLQNADGSFSTEWFEGRGSDPNVEKKVQTTGHILEWLVYTLPDDQLDSPQVVKSVRFLLGTIGANPSRDWPIGPRGHSLRALALYNQRVFGAPAGNMKKHLASLRLENTQR